MGNHFFRGFKTSILSDIYNAMGNSVKAFLNFQKLIFLIWENHSCLKKKNRIALVSKTKKWETTEAAVAAIATKSKALKEQRCF